MAKAAEAGRDVGTLLESLAGRVRESSTRSAAAIAVTCTDTEEHFTVDGLGRKPTVSRGEPSSPPAVHVRGTSDVINAVLSGELEASQAFARGGIRVRGDLAHLEAVLKELGLLQCE
jgi:putative sterol carrier protein